MKKLLLLIIIIAIAASFSVGSFIKLAIEKAGTAALGVPLTVTAAYISPLSGKAEVKGLRIKNPIGFSDDDMIALSSVNIELELASLLTDVVHIKSITVDNPSILYEMNGSLNNVSMLRKNLAVRSGDAPIQKEQAASPKKQLRIDHVAIRATTLRVAMKGVDISKTQLTLPDVVMNDVGGKNQAIDAQKASEIILSAFLDAAGKADLNAIISGVLKDKLKALKQDPSKALELLKGDDVKGAGDLLKNQLKGLR